MQDLAYIYRGAAQVLILQMGIIEPSHTILVNSRRLSVNRNLHDFLSVVRSLKYRKPGHWQNYHLRSDFWIDAIRINQSSHVERNQQVAQISKIYTQARSVMMKLEASRKEIFIHWACCATLYDMHHQERTLDPCMDNLRGHVSPEAKFGLQKPHSPIARIDHRNGMGTPAKPYSFAKAGPRRCSAPQKQFDAPSMIREWQNAREQRKRMGNLRLLYWLDAFRDARCEMQPAARQCSRLLGWPKRAFRSQWTTACL